MSKELKNKSLDVVVICKYIRLSVDGYHSGYGVNIYQLTKD